MRLFKIRNNGFSLVEVLITVAIIGIISAIAIPNYIKYKVEARRGEASHFLPAIHGTQIEYFGEEGQYTSAVSDLTVDNPTGTYYKYFLCDVSASFLGDGTANGAACVDGTNCLYWSAACNLTLGYAAIASGQIDDDVLLDNIAIGDKGKICPPDTCGRMTNGGHTALPFANSPNLNNDVDN